MDKHDFTNSGLVVMPSVGTLNDYRIYIQNLPQQDSTELFGLHPNAEINYQHNEVKNIFDTLFSIQPMDSSGGKIKISRED